MNDSRRGIAMDSLLGPRNRLLLIVVAVGLLGGLVGAAFVGALNLLERILWPTHTSTAVHLLILVGVGISVGVLTHLLGTPGDVELGLAVRRTPRLEALAALATGAASARAPDPDPVVTARLALAAGDAAAAFEAALAGDDPDTLLLAARAVGPAAVDRALAAATALSRAQALRFARELGRAPGG